jgi:diguanylate cyclase (GGDEF)-like protein
MVDGLAGRLGGEEFCILGNGELADAWECARELQRSLKALRFAHNGDAFGITCSFGIAEWEPGDAIDRMLRRADVAMYESKKTGRDRITAADTFAATTDHDEWRGAIRADASRA